MPSGAAQSARVLQEVSGDSAQGALAVAASAGLVTQLACICGRFAQYATTHEVVAPSLLTLAHVCRRLAQQQSPQPQQRPAPALFNAPFLLRAAVHCAIQLSYAETLAAAEDASGGATMTTTGSVVLGVEARITRLAATARLLKGLADWFCAAGGSGAAFKSIHRASKSAPTSSSDGISSPKRPTTTLVAPAVAAAGAEESRTAASSGGKDFFIAGGGATALLALSGSTLRAVARPARVALASTLDLVDLARMAQPTFELDAGCPLVDTVSGHLLLLKKQAPEAGVVDGEESGATTTELDCQGNLLRAAAASDLLTKAAAALSQETAKREASAQRDRGAIAGHRKKAQAANPVAAREAQLAQRQKKLEAWLGKRDEKAKATRAQQRAANASNRASEEARRESLAAERHEERARRSAAAEQYRLDLLERHAEAKRKQAAAREAQREAEAAASENKKAASQEKVEQWLAKKRAAMKVERERELSRQRAAHRKNMRYLRKMNARTFGGHDNLPDSYLAVAQPATDTAGAAGAEPVAVAAPRKVAEAVGAGPYSETAPGRARRAVLPGSTVRRRAKKRAASGTGTATKAVPPPPRVRNDQRRDQMYAPSTAGPVFTVKGVSLDQHF